MKEAEMLDLEEKIEVEAMHELNSVGIKKCIVNSKNEAATTGNRIKITHGKVQGSYTINAITDTVLVLDESHVLLKDIYDFELVWRE